MKLWKTWICWLLALMIWEAQAGGISDPLKGSDHVLLMRHAYAPGVGDPPGYVLERCETQRVLNQEGKNQAARIGRWLRGQGVQKALVFTSPWCRCRQTAELLNVGPVTVEPSLASFFDASHLASAQNASLQALISQALKAKGEQPLILVTHHVNILAFMGQNIGSGDMVLARVNPQGQLLSYTLIQSP
jgi:phosphohistidine phosphatase SixA